MSNFTQDEEKEVSLVDEEPLSSVNLDEDYDNDELDYDEYDEDEDDEGENYPSEDEWETLSISEGEEEGEASSNEEETGWNIEYAGEGEEEFDWNAYAEEIENEEQSEDDEFSDHERTSSEEMYDEEAAERKAKRLEILQEQKEELIIRYLTMMSHIRKLKKHNFYLEDKLYKICIRKQLIVLHDKKRVSSNATTKAANRLKKQKKKLDAKMKLNYDAYVHYKPPVNWGAEIRGTNKKTKARLKRERILRRPDPVPPKYKRKVDTRIVTINGTQYKIILRSKGRNWLEKAEYRILLARNSQEVLHGHPDVPKQRTLLKVPEHITNKFNTNTRTFRKQEVVKTTDAEIYDENFEFKRNKENKSGTTLCKGKNCKNNNNNNNKTRVPTAESGTKGDKNHRHQNHKSRSHLHMHAASSHQNKTLGRGGGRAGKRKSSHYQPSHLHLKKHCRIKDKKKKLKFRELRWFSQGNKLRGRKFSGQTLLSAEKSHLMNFVNDAMLTGSAQKRAHKLKLQRQRNSVAQDFNDAIIRLHQLIIKKSDLETEHRKSLEEKSVDWGIWEKRDTLAAEGLLHLFKTFVHQYQSYFTKREQRIFNAEISDFDKLFIQSHTKLNELLLKMYKSRMILIMLQRRMKDKTNQALIKQGHTLTDYELRVGDNNAMYKALQKRELDLEASKQKLQWVMKRVVLTRNLKFTKEKLIASNFNTHHIIVEDAHLCQKHTSAAMHQLIKIHNTHRPLTLNVALMERKNLYEDFKFTKKSLERLEARKRRLARRVYLAGRELNSIHVRTQNARLDIRQFKNQTQLFQMESELKAHKAKLAGRLSRLSFDMQCKKQSKK